MTRSKDATILSNQGSAAQASFNKQRDIPNWFPIGGREMKRFAMIALVGLSVLAAPMAVSTPVAAKGLSKAWGLALGAIRTK